ncbi:hypothetical protein [Streptomyces sp. NPDC007172]|uniref:hypothetical protein n=1 Tax=Streptomyces sp. NPDC007172 TaxID=3364776 RepID=UPI003690BFBF
MNAARSPRVARSPRPAHTSHPAPAAISAEHLNDPRSLAFFRGAKVLVGAYLGISVLTLAVIVLLRGDSADVNSAVWVRGTIVAVSALVTLLCAVRAARGSRSAYRRLRIISAVSVVAIAAVVALPGTFPAWLKAEQAACGLLLVAVVALVNGKHVRSVFAAG